MGLFIGFSTRRLKGADGVTFAACGVYCVAAEIGEERL